MAPELCKEETHHTAQKIYTLQYLCYQQTEGGSETEREQEIRDQDSYVETPAGGGGGADPKAQLWRKDVH